MAGVHNAAGGGKEAISSEAGGRKFRGGFDVTMAGVHNAAGGERKRFQAKRGGGSLEEDLMLPWRVGARGGVGEKGGVE